MNFAKTSERHAASNRQLERAREKSREARAELIGAIICDEKDVLASSDIEEIQKALTAFLKVQKKLGAAFSRNSDNFARLLWQVPDSEKG
ncbi:MAG TPA: hypothetical protein VJJ55_00960 [Candidatus Paceibacterota bacterium]